MKKLILASFIAAVFSVNAYASFYVEGVINASRPNPAYNINPYNVSTIYGVGEGNNFKILTPQGDIQIDLDYPLYRLNKAYADAIKCVDGKWGVERNVGIKIFDGSEDWSLYEKAAFKNNNTTIFKCSFGDNPPRILNGVSTHFDVHTFDTQKKNIYDGISFGENSSEILMRIMNVRNIKDVDTLKNYIKSQYDNKTPIKLLYFLDKPIFNEFEESIQKKLSSVDPNSVRYIDKYCQGIKNDIMPKADTKFFVSENSGNKNMDVFLSAVKNVKIFTSKYERVFVNGIYTDNNGIKFEINYGGDLISEYISLSDINFINDKETEISFDTGNGVIKMYVDFSCFKIPVENITGFDYEKTGIRRECMAERELVIPPKIYALEGTSIDFNNSRLNNDGNQNSMIIKDSNYNIVSTDGRLKVEGEENKKYYVPLANGDVYDTEVICYKAKENIFKDKTIMFLGDSLINQDLYTKFFTQIAKNENMTLIGTRGQEGNAHEGRGGWSAYDYCNEKNKYGFSNPFMNEKGEFDFGYYMKNNNFESVDYVIVNLGINDINIKGHNSHDEILYNFSKIVKSIKDYNSDIKIVWNTPIMLFGTESTDTAKNERLEFIKDMYAHFSEEVYISPIYMNIDSFNDFKFVMAPVDEFNQDSSMKVNDTTHPNNFGYETLAKATYAFLQSVD